MKSQASAVTVSPESAECFSLWSAHDDSMTLSTITSPRLLMTSRSESTFGWVESVLLIGDSATRATTSGACHRAAYAFFDESPDWRILAEV